MVSVIQPFVPTDQSQYTLDHQNKKGLEKSPFVSKQNNFLFISECLAALNIRTLVDYVKRKLNQLAIEDTP